MAGRLAYKRCLIVGGTAGIGRASAEVFLSEGARLVVAGLPDGQGEAAERELSRTGSIRFFPCDATDGGQVEQLFRKAVETLGGLDVLFHVAGASGRSRGDGPLHECTEDGWHFTIQTNLTSVFHTNRLAVQHFLSTSGGVILNVSSVLAVAPDPQFFDTCGYTAAKGAIVSMSRLAAARYARNGIRVNVLAPGLIDTPMSQRALTDPAIRTYVEKKQPLAGGAGQPIDVAAAAVYLCSDEARLVTGQFLAVDGGWLVSGD